MGRKCVVSVLLLPAQSNIQTVHTQQLCQVQPLSVLSRSHHIPLYSICISAFSLQEVETRWMECFRSLLAALWLLFMLIRCKKHQRNKTEKRWLLVLTSISTRRHLLFIMSQILCVWIFLWPDLTHCCCHFPPHLKSVFQGKLKT